MNEIQKALRILGLDPGSSKDAVQRRYKRLIMVWHPDRFPTAEGKADAEEELKKINNAKDVLYKHFDDGSHKASGCECQSDGAGSGRSNTNQGAHTGSERQDNSADAEAEARRRDQERRRRASETREEYARKQREQEARTTSDAQARDLEEAQKQQAALKDNQLRWKVAAVEAAIFFGLIFFAWTGFGLKEWWHDVTWRWQVDHPSQPANTDTSTGTGGLIPNPYINPR
jgi:curved DNA-binding protein CbpA